MDYYSADALIINEADDAILSRLSPLRKFDWIPENRFKGKTLAEVLEKYCKSYLKKGYKDEYLTSWLRGYSTFGAGWKVQYTRKSNRKFTVAEILEDLQRKKIPFRIDSLWDLGFIAAKVNKEVTPGRVQVDEYNNKHRFEDPYNLLEVPENDWVQRFNAENVEDVVRKMNSYVKIQTSEKSI